MGGESSESQHNKRKYGADITALAEKKKLYHLKNFSSQD
jgi:hypothetical protein